MQTNSLEWAARLAQARDRMEGMPGATSVIAEMSDVIQRIRAGRRVISVFGAFSAGKSSLLNALMEEQVLVVSPNPTTASVTQLEYGESRTSEAYIVVKSPEQLWNDVQSAVRDLHREASDLESALQLGSSIRLSDVPPSARRSLMFIKGVQSGFAEMYPHLGKTLTVGWAEAKRFTAEERYACFVMRVEARHHASFLENGVCLVDTPGVDSVNQRHTDVAFDYMRKADAVVFVIYYTHAFSRADKDFLLQLAGVQDVVGKDKLFVVINAVDLATSDQERLEVRQRVEKELRQFGLRGTRIFEVSSQLAYAATRLRQEPQEPSMTALVRQRLGLAEPGLLPSLDEISAIAGVEAFRHELLAFVKQKSDELLTDAAGRVWNSTERWLNSRLVRLEQERHADEELRAAIAAGREACVQSLHEFTRMADARRALPEELDRVAAEAKELAFHATERIRFRLPELVREAFHPGRFIQDGQARKRLQESAEELASWLLRQWEVECRTLSLRMGVLATNVMERWIAEWGERLQEVGLDDCASGQRPMTVEETQDRLIAFPSEGWPLTWQSFQKGFSHFSSPKQFFEGGGQKAMIEEYESVIRPCLQSAQQTFVQIVSKHITNLILDQLSVWARHVATTAEQNTGLGEISAKGLDASTVEGVLAWFQDVSASL